MTSKARDIGIGVKPPESGCDDPNCPFHGTLSVRGQVMDCVVKSVKMDGTAVVERNYLQYHKKYERFEKRSGRFSVHVPACIHLEAGDNVTIMECRPLAKTVSFVVVERRV